MKKSAPSFPCWKKNQPISTNSKTAMTDSSYPVFTDPVSPLTIPVINQDKVISGAMVFGKRDIWHLFCRLRFLIKV
jgi:hypothetical protein